MAADHGSLPVRRSPSSEPPGRSTSAQASPAHPLSTHPQASPPSGRQSFLQSSQCIPCHHQVRTPHAHGLNETPRDRIPHIWHARCLFNSHDSPAALPARLPAGFHRGRSPRQSRPLRHRHRLVRRLRLHRRRRQRRQPQRHLRQRLGLPLPQRNRPLMVAGRPPHRPHHRPHPHLQPRRRSPGIRRQFPPHRLPQRDRGLQPDLPPFHRHRQQQLPRMGHLRPPRHHRRHHPHPAGLQFNPGHQLPHLRRTRNLGRRHHRRPAHHPSHHHRIPRRCRHRHLRRHRRRHQWQLQLPRHPRVPLQHRRHRQILGGRPRHRHAHLLAPPLQPHRLPGHQQSPRFPHQHHRHHHLDPRPPLRPRHRHTLQLRLRTGTRHRRQKGQNRNHHRGNPHSSRNPDLRHSARRPPSHRRHTPRHCHRSHRR